MIEPNPCIFCRRKPSVGPWVDEDGDNKHGFSVFCFKGLSTHALQVFGRTRAAAIRRWNRLNPVEERPGKVLIHEL